MTNNRADLREIIEPFSFYPCLKPVGVALEAGQPVRTLVKAALQSGEIRGPMLFLELSDWLKTSTPAVTGEGGE